MIDWLVVLVPAFAFLGGLVMVRKATRAMRRLAGGVRRTSSPPPLKTEVAFETAPTRGGVPWNATPQWTAPNPPRSTKSAANQARQAAFAIVILLAGLAIATFAVIRLVAIISTPHVGLPNELLGLSRASQFSLTSTPSDIPLPEGRAPANIETAAFGDLSNGLLVRIGVAHQSVGQPENLKDLLEKPTASGGAGFNLQQIRGGPETGTLECSRPGLSSVCMWRDCSKWIVVMFLGAGPWNHPEAMTDIHEEIGL